MTAGTLIPISTRQGQMTIDLKSDYHAHILPGCDHGSDSVETSLGQLELAKAAGVDRICATPHFYPNNESVTSFLERRQRTYENLKNAAVGDYPEILLGAEVLICDGMERLTDLTKLCLEGTNELLLEMPFYEWPSNIWDTVFELNDIDELQIVIAHADRYPVKDIEILIKEGIPLQLNAVSLMNVFKRGKYLSWIDGGYVSYLGSDIHGLGEEYRYFEKCAHLLERRYGKRENA